MLGGGLRELCKGKGILGFLGEARWWRPAVLQLYCTALLSWVEIDLCINLLQDYQMNQND